MQGSRQRGLHLGCRKRDLEGRFGNFAGMSGQNMKMPVLRGRRAFVVLYGWMVIGMF
jgi:hypothetical protein